MGVGGAVKVPTRCLHSVALAALDTHARTRVRLGSGVGRSASVDTMGSETEGAANFTLRYVSRQACNASNNGKTRGRVLDYCRDGGSFRPTAGIRKVTWRSQSVRGAISRYLV